MSDGCPEKSPVELSDGRVIYPEDPITLADVCEIVPLILETLMKAETKGKVAPGMPVPIARGGVSPTFGPSTAPTGFGPRPGAIAGPGLFGGTIPFGAGGGGFPAGGGGGRGAPGPQGIQGPPGGQGPPGPGAIVDFIVKTDGDFVVGPGAFVPVPGTLVNFSTSESGPALFFVQATLSFVGLSTPQNAQLGIRVDGIDYPLTVRSMTGAGVSEFQIGQSPAFPISLGTGVHTAEFLLRALLPGEFGGGTGIPTSVHATASIPFALSVLHK